MGELDKLLKRDLSEPAYVEELRAALRKAERERDEARAALLNERERAARVCERRAERWRLNGLDCGTMVASVLGNVAAEIRKGE